MKIFAILLLFTLELLAEQSDRIVPTYNFTGKEAEIWYLIDIEGNDSALLSMLFEPKHILKYAGRTNLVIKPVSEMTNRNNLEYHYNYLVAQLFVEMKRERFPVERKINFSMIRYSKSSPIIPLVKSIEGSYRIITKNGKKQIEYHQKTVMDKEIHKVYQALIKRDVRRFIRETVSYLDKHSAVNVTETK